MQAHLLSLPRRFSHPALLVIGLIFIFALAGCQPIQPESSDGASVEAVAPVQVNAPVSLSIPAVRLETAVEPMGWRVVEVNGARTTEWIVPDAVAGWHVNSAGMGDTGNVILSGHQATGAAVFAPLAVDEVKVGQEIVLTGADGSSMRYQVVEVSEPLPIEGASQREQNQVAAYMAQSEEPRLTLITGWPAFTTSHRIFVIASPLSE